MVKVKKEKSSAGQTKRNWLIRIRNLHLGHWEARKGSVKKIPLDTKGTLCREEKNRAQSRIKT